jgi:hypothetical protein
MLSQPEWCAKMAVFIFVTWTYIEGKERKWKKKFSVFGFNLGM